MTDDHSPSNDRSRSQIKEVSVIRNGEDIEYLIHARIIPAPFHSSRSNRVPGEVDARRDAFWGIQGQT